MITNKELQTTLINILIAVLPIISAFIIRILNLKANQIKQSTKNDKIGKYIDLAKEIVVKSVIAVNQTYVENLKQNNQFTQEKAKEAFDLAKNRIVSILTQDTKNAIILLYGDLNSFLDSQIEMTVSNIKKFK